MYLALNVALALFIVLANYADLTPRGGSGVRSGLRALVHGLLALGDLALCGLGTLLVMVGLLADFTAAIAPAGSGMESAGFVGGLMIATGLLGGAMLVPGVRRWLAQHLDIDPDSCVHTMALTLAAYATGMGVLQLLLWADLSEALSTSVEFTAMDLVSSASLMLILTLTGVGLLVRRSPAEAAERLGLRKVTWRQLLLVVALIAAFLIADAAIGWAWHSLDPQAFEREQANMDQMFGGLMTGWGLVAISLVAGTGEELLFRGALQPRFGLALTALLFTLGHFQYAFSPGMVEVLLIGLALGHLRRRAGTVPCLLVHAGYNLANVLLMSLAG